MLKLTSKIAHIYSQHFQTECKLSNIYYTFEEKQL